MLGYVNCHSCFVNTLVSQIFVYDQRKVLSLNSISMQNNPHKTKQFLHSKALTNSTLNEFCCNKNYYYWKVVNNSYTCMYCFQIYKYITLCIVLNKQRNIALILNIYCDTKSTVVIVLVFDVHSMWSQGLNLAILLLHVCPLSCIVWIKDNFVLMLWRCSFVYQVFIELGWWTRF